MGGPPRQDQHPERAGSRIFRDGLRRHRQGHYQGRVGNTCSREDRQRVGQSPRENRVPERGVCHEGVHLSSCGEHTIAVVDGG